MSAQPEGKGPLLALIHSTSNSDRPSHSDETKAQKLTGPGSHCRSRRPREGEHSESEGSLRHSQPCKLRLGQARQFFSATGRGRSPLRAAVLVLG